MLRSVPPALILFTVLISGCLNQQNEGNGSIDTIGEEEIESVFFDYRINAEEGDDNLTVILQFRDGGLNENTLIVDEGSGKVELDGVELKMDSTERSGAYYETHQPLDQFTGKHRISFIFGKKKFEEEFYFEPMRFREELPDTISREDLEFELTGLEKEDYVRVLLFDTSYYGEGINRMDTVINGRIRLAETDWDELSNGEIQLELHREFEKPVENGTEAGGRILMGYVLKRRFILKD